MYDHFPPADRSRRTPPSCTDRTADVPTAFYDESEDGALVRQSSSTSFLENLSSVKNWIKRLFQRMSGTRSGSTSEPDLLSFGASSGAARSHTPDGFRCADLGEEQKFAYDPVAKLWKKQGESDVAALARQRELEREGKVVCGAVKADAVLAGAPAPCRSGDGPQHPPGAGGAAPPPMDTRSDSEKQLVQQRMGKGGTLSYTDWTTGVNVRVLGAGPAAAPPTLDELTKSHVRGNDGQYQRFGRNRDGSITAIPSCTGGINHIGTACGVEVRERGRRECGGTGPRGTVAGGCVVSQERGQRGRGLAGEERQGVEGEKATSGACSQMWTGAGPRTEDRPFPPQTISDPFAGAISNPFGVR